MGARVASLVALVVLVGATVLLLQRGLLIGAGPIAVAVQVLAFLLMVWARVTFGARSFHAAANPTAGGLVTSGPYRWVRHPIYAAILYFVAAGVLSHLSSVSVALLLAVLAGVMVRVLAEERLLVEMYPEYRDYAARTRRFVPFVV